METKDNILTKTDYQISDFPIYTSADFIGKNGSIFKDYFEFTLYDDLYWVHIHNIRVGPHEDGGLYYQDQRTAIALDKLNLAGFHAHTNSNIKQISEAEFIKIKKLLLVNKIQ